MGGIFIRVNIRIYREIIHELNELIPDFGDSIRLVAKTRFKMKGNSWSKTMDAILDTGAPISVLPHDLWKRLDVKILAANYPIKGIVPKKECEILVDIGEITGVLLDKEGNMTPKIRIYAYLAKTELIPIIIGFKHFLEIFRVCFDYKNDEAFVEGD